MHSFSAVTSDALRSLITMFTSVPTGTRLRKGPLAEATGLSERAVRSGVAELVNRRLLAVVTDRVNGGYYVADSVEQIDGEVRQLSSHIDETARRIAALNALRSQLPSTTEPQATGVLGLLDEALEMLTDLTCENFEYVRQVFADLPNRLHDLRLRLQDADRVAAPLM